MKEIKQYVANDLFRCQKKTTELYEEFNRVKNMREEMKVLYMQ